MANRHSIRKRPAIRAGIPRSSDFTRSKAAKDKAADKSPDFDESLGHLSEAMALIETAYSVLDVAQESAEHITPSVITLERGLGELRRAYTELELASQRHR